MGALDRLCLEDLRLQVGKLEAARSCQEISGCMRRTCRGKICRFHHARAGCKCSSCSPVANIIYLARQVLDCVWPLVLFPLLLCFGPHIHLFVFIYSPSFYGPYDVMMVE